MFQILYTVGPFEIFVPDRIDIANFVPVVSRRVNYRNRIVYQGRKLSSYSAHSRKPRSICIRTVLNCLHFSFFSVEIEENLVFGFTSWRNSHIWPNMLWLAGVRQMVHLNGVGVLSCSNHFPVEVLIGICLLRYRVNSNDVEDKSIRHGVSESKELLICAYRGAEMPAVRLWNSSRCSVKYS